MKQALTWSIVIETVADVTLSPIVIVLVVGKKSRPGVA